jgi:hypothetical protein
MAGQQRSGLSSSDALFAGGVLTLAGLVGVAWCAAAVSALICGHPAPRLSLRSVASVPTDWQAPSAAWGSPVGPAWVYWAVTAGLLVAIGAAGIAVTRRLRRPHERADTDPRLVRGVATRREVRRTAGERALLARSRTLRPALPQAAASDVGTIVGRSRGVECWVSVEDSVVVLGGWCDSAVW